MHGFDACPFCRELFAPTPAGTRALCPLCEVRLVRATALPPLPEGLSDFSDLCDGNDPDDEPPVAPDDQRLPWTYLRHGRGLLVALALGGLTAFGLPWVHMYTPERVVFSGVDMAARTGFSWSAGVAWFTLLPLVLSRRSLRALRGARLAAAVLSAIPVILVLTLLAQPPTSAQARGVLVRLRFDWGPGLFLTLALGLASTLVAVFFLGGKDCRSKR